MKLLEMFASTGGQSIETIVDQVLESEEEGRLMAIIDLLDKMNDLGLLQEKLVQTVQEKLVDLTRDARGESTGFAFQLKNLAGTLGKQVRFMLHKRASNCKKNNSIF